MRFLVTVLALFALVTSCAPGGLVIPQPAHHEPEPRPQDRDEQDILATLANTNPCLLVKTAKVRLVRPHRCDIGTQASVEFVNRLDHGRRYYLPKKEIDGVKVDSINAHDGHCSLDVPVSFRYAVRVTAIACPAAEDYATTVLTRLDRSGEARHKQGKPDLSTDACTVFGGAITGTGRIAAVNPVPVKGSIDDCEFYADQVTDVKLSMRLAADPAGSKKWATIAGKTIHRQDCRWTWSQGPFDRDTVRLITLEVPDCSGPIPAGLPKQLVAGLVTQLGKPVRPSGAALLPYRAGEPDEPYSGACVDYPADDCRPAQAMPTPRGVGPKTAAAVADQHMACDLAAPAVRSQFAGLRPVVTGAKSPSCQFVEPSHALRIEVRVIPGDLDMIAPSHARELTVNGRPATYRENPKAASLCVDSGYLAKDRDANWYWCMNVTFSTADVSGKAKLEPAMNAFAREHLR